jgi:macrophage erythroblast attacher
MSAVLNTILNLRKDEKVDKAKVRLLMASLLDRMVTLKKKMNEFYKEEEETYEICKKRLLHLNNASTQQPDDQTEYHKVKINRMIVEYLAREGFSQAAEKMMKNFTLDDFSALEFKIAQENNQVVESLTKRSCDEALRWCAANKSKLNKLKSPLEFKLILQQYFELLKQKKTKEAITFMRKHSVQHQAFHFDEIKKAMACIVYLDGLDKYPKYKYYFDDQRWTDLVDLFKQENFRVTSLTSQPLLNMSLQGGLSTLKTKTCTNKKHKCPNKCPLCDDSVQKVHTPSR